MVSGTATGPASPPSRAPAARARAGARRPAARARASRRRRRPWRWRGPPGCRSRRRDAQHDGAVLLAQLELGGAGVGVARDVGQATPGRRGRPRDPASGLERGQVGPERVPHPQPGAAAEGRASVVSALRSPSSSSGPGPQAARDLAHLLDPGARRLLHLRDLLLQVGGARRWISSNARTTPVSVCPTSSCSSRATRSRSPSWAASARRALPWRSASRRSSMSLNARASSATSAAGFSIATRRPGSSGSTRRIVPVSRSSGPKMPPQQQDVERDHERRAADQHLDLRRRRRRAHAAPGSRSGRAPRRPSRRR